MNNMVFTTHRVFRYDTNKTYEQFKSFQTFTIQIKKHLLYNSVVRLVR